MTTPTIETDLGKILDQINQNLAEFRQETNQKLESIQKDVTVLQVDMATVKTEIVGLKEDIKEIKGEIKDLKASQRNQIWALIGILGTAVVATVIRFLKKAGGRRLPPFRGDRGGLAGGGQLEEDSNLSQLPFSLKEEAWTECRGKGGENLLPSALCPLPSKAEALVKGLIIQKLRRSKSRAW